MCGIAGFQGRFDGELLERMARRIAHRGPDGSGAVLFHERGIITGFAHRRLAIIDLSETGHQPMTVRCKRCGAHSLNELAITYNGEVYNYRELRRQLEQRGHTFTGSSDTEVLLHLYAEHGLTFLSKLNGIFAFALRDGRSAGHPVGVRQGDVLIARDPLGVKPLYVAETGAGVLFASELKALLESDAVPRRIDAEALHYTLAYLWTPAPSTMLQDVRKLTPGEARLLRSGRTTRSWQFYDLPVSAPMRDSPGVLAAKLARHVQSAVERQLVADVEVGAFLSGGVDSSSIVALMRRIANGSRPVCYCIGFTDPRTGSEGQDQDLHYAKVVARHVGAELRPIEVDASIIRQLERMLYFLDEPQADPAPINALLICEAARRDGLKVLMSGAGGDDVFSGYRRHRALLAERWWNWWPAPARALLQQTTRAAARGRPQLRRFARAFHYAQHAPEDRLISYFWWSDDGLRRPLLSGELRQQLTTVNTAEPLRTTLAALPRNAHPLQRMLYLEQKHFLADHNLNYTDRMGMAVGVEVRVPLLDLELLEFAAGIPPQLKQHGSAGKYLFKKAMAPYLPAGVLRRPKTGFGAPLRHWLRNELRDYIETELSEAALARYGLFDYRAVQSLIRADRSAQVDGAYTIFALLCVQLWCKLFLGQQPLAAARTPVIYTNAEITTVA